MATMMPSVLIVEDNAIIANDIADELESRGMNRIQMAGSLREALRAISQNLPDIAIVDLTLRDGRTGAQLARALATSGVKVCVLSGQSTLSPELMSIAHTYIAKPTPSSIVASVIEEQAHTIAMDAESRLH